MPELKYLGGYPPALIASVRELIAAGRLGATLAQRYPDGHEVRTDLGASGTRAPCTLGASLSASGEAVPVGSPDVLRK